MAADRLRVILTRDQASNYLDRLKIPAEKRCYDVAPLKHEDALNYLALLQKHHLAEVPFENLTLHYSAHHQVSTHLDEVFKKIVTDNNGRGGYCMENNALFGTLLRTLGFNVYSGGGRVWEGDSWTGWGHRINFVTIGDTKYHVDVGFGGEVPIVPMPLEHTGIVQPHISPATARLQWRNIAGSTDLSQRLWVYECRRNDEAEWETKYCFSELEFLPFDFNAMNYYTSTNRKTFFTRLVVLEKKLLNDEGEYKGSAILNGNTLKWRVHGVKEEEIVFQTEAERLDALEKHFGIRFGAAEREGIIGLASELK